MIRLAAAPTTDTMTVGPRSDRRDPRPDEALLAAWATDRDETALATLLDRHWSRAFGLARRLVGDPAAAEDVAQEAFCKLASSAGRFRSDRAFDPWFCSIVLNTARKAHRSETRRSRHEEVAARVDAERRAHASDPATEEDASAAAAALPEHVERLSDKLRDAVVLRYFEGLPLKDVADALGCSVGTATSRVRRATERLRESLAGAGLVVASVSLPALLLRAPTPVGPIPPIPAVAPIATKAVVVAKTSALLTVGGGLAAATLAVVAAIPLLVALAPDGIDSAGPGGGALIAAGADGHEDHGHDGADHADGADGAAPEKPARPVTTPALPARPAAASPRVAVAGEGEGAAPELPAAPIVLVSRWAEGFADVAFEASPAGVTPPAAATHRQADLRMVDVDLDRVPLEDVLDALGRGAGLPIRLSPRAAALVEDEELEVSLRLRAITLRSTLQLVIAASDQLAWEILEDGSIEVVVDEERRELEADEAPTHDHVDLAAEGADRGAERWRAALAEETFLRIPEPGAPIADAAAILGARVRAMIHFGEGVDRDALVVADDDALPAGAILKGLADQHGLEVEIDDRCVWLLSPDEAAAARDERAAAQRGRKRARTILAAQLDAPWAGRLGDVGGPFAAAAADVDVALAVPDGRLDATVALAAGMTLETAAERLAAMADLDWRLYRPLEPGARWRLELSSRLDRLAVCRDLLAAVGASRRADEPERLDPLLRAAEKAVARAEGIRARAATAVERVELGRLRAELELALQASVDRTTEAVALADLAAADATGPVAPDRLVALYRLGWAHNATGVWDGQHALAWALFGWHAYAWPPGTRPEHPGRALVGGE